MGLAKWHALRVSFGVRSARVSPAQWACERGSTHVADPKDLSKINRLRVFTDKPEQFEPEKKYSFTVKLKQPFPAGQAITSVDLVTFEPLK